MRPVLRRAWRPVVLPPAPPASSEAVRRVLQRNGRRDTAPELALRRELHALGLRFLVDATPAGTSRRRRSDVVLRSSRIAVHVHGCFWHRCPEHFHAPKANAGWWQAKFDSIVARDADTERQLRAAGWLPVVVWQHEDMAAAASRIAALHAERRRPPAPTGFQGLTSARLWRRAESCPMSPSRCDHGPRAAGGLMPVSPPDLQRGWTLDDLHLLPDDGQRYELVDGGLVVTPPPTQLHQMLRDDLRERLQAAAPPGWRARLEFPLPFAQDTQRIPDVVVHRWPLRHPRSDERNPVGPADVGLIVEVVSPSTRRTDRFAKPGEYAEAGIALFWRLETEPDLVLHAFVLTAGAYEPLPPVRHEGSVPVPWGSLIVDVGTLGV